MKKTEAEIVEWYAWEIKALTESNHKLFDEGMEWHRRYVKLTEQFEEEIKDFETTYARVAKLDSKVYRLENNSNKLLEKRLRGKIKSYQALENRYKKLLKKLREYEGKDDKIVVQTEKIEITDWQYPTVNHYSVNREYRTMPGLVAECYGLEIEFDYNKRFRVYDYNEN